MSEYWKSTPKYWCKHCKTFVRDTKLEKTNHEATAKHQGNIKRFLRDLHRGHEREERDKDRAKNEVDRLNGLVSGTSAAADHAVSQGRQIATPPGAGGRDSTPAERKAQLAKLAEMGVAVPEHYRREVAMAGDWQTVAERPLWTPIKKEEGLEDFKNFKPDTSLNLGIRKRKFDGQEEEEEAGQTVVRTGWGSTTRQYPGPTGDGEEDLDALLGIKPVSERGKQDTAEEHSLEAALGVVNGAQGAQAVEAASQAPALKQEGSTEALDLSNVPVRDNISVAAIKQEDRSTQPSVVFKKRKAKSSAKS
ncbi:MAG: hypothetical protein LQ346_007853 [Caloplaca aetnensis]|nr:MAG: hypothetical protein LQ346_007853 [Caloplaca aetnensis]